MPKNNDVAVTQQPITAESLMMMAIEKGQVDVMDRLMDMRRQLREEHAKSEFDKAMSAFQAECPTVTKGKEVSANGKVLRKYAPIEDVIAVTRPYMQANGLSYSFDTEYGEKGVTVYCTAKHTEGHRETTKLYSPFITATGMMNNSQVSAGTITFAKRYALCNAFGIIIGGEDADGEKQVQSNVSSVDGTKEAEKLLSIASRDEARAYFASLPADVRGSEQVRDAVKTMSSRV